MTERQAILATLNEYALAYCAKDIERIMRLFDKGNDISVVGTGGDELCSGPSDIRRLFERNFVAANATGFSWGWQHVTIVDEFALVATEVSIDIDKHNVEMTVPLRWTVALVKRREGWKWLHRNASIAAGGQKAGDAYPTSQVSK